MEGGGDRGFGMPARRETWISEYSGARVLITGADGFIGSHLAETLADGGAEVTALCLYNSFDAYGWLDEARDTACAKLRRVRGDIRDAAFVRRIVSGQDVVFHLAALIAIPHSYVAAQSYLETNVLGTLNMLEASRESRVARLVQTSTSEVYGTALTLPITESHPLQGQSPYSASKIGADMMAEAFARSFDLPVAILRPFNTYGPRQSERAVISTVIRQLLDPDCLAVKIGDVSTVRDFTFVEDTVDAFLAIGSAPTIEFGRAYNAGTGKAVTIAEMIELAADITGCNKPIQRDPDRMRPANSEVRALLADSGRLAAASGWRPHTEFKVGLSHTIAWWLDRLAAGRVRHRSDYMV